MEKEKTQPKEATAPKISSIEDLFRKAVELYKKCYQTILGLMLIGVLTVLPMIVVATLLFVTVALVGGEPNTFLMLFSGVLAVVLFLAVIYISVSAQAGTFLYFKKSEPQKGVFAIFNKARKNYFWPFLWLHILAAIILMVGFMLLIVPGIILLVYFSLISWVLIFEDTQGFEAIKRSTNLVRGYWWAIVGRFLAVYIPVYIVGALPAMVFEQGPALQFTNFLFQILFFLITPFFIAYHYLIYKDLVKIKTKSQKKAS